MDLKELKRMIAIVEQSNINEVEIEEAGAKIRISKGQPTFFASAPQMVSAPAQAPAAAPAAPVAAPAEPIDDGFEAIKSPMVGTFYRAPSPDSDPYVQVGDTINENTVICIVEAMKVMNEIKAGIKGVVKEILIENGQPVEFGRTMFKVKKS